MTRTRYRREWLLKAMTLLIGLALGLVLCEVVLRVFFSPYRVSTIGHRGAPNAALYGWGYDPGERFFILDPDTGAVYPSKANRHGWRDREHTHANPNHAYRIVILGDSNAFGAIVPQDKTLSRDLERMLLADGYDAEVIGIAYGGWGTDQELEALIHDGVLYHPDLVIVQYTTNDIEDNVYYEHPESGISKPFRYRLDRHGALVRETNRGGGGGRWSASAWHKWAKQWLLRSELIARLYGAWTWYKLVYRPEHEHYLVTDSQITRLRLVIGLDDHHPLVRYLRTRVGESLDRSALEALIARTGLESRRGLILRICENRWFNRLWKPSTFDPPAPDPRSTEWRLFFALLDEIRRVAARAGARTAVYSEIDEAGFDWNVAWGLVRDSKANLAKHLAYRDLTERYARKQHILVIPNPRPLTRARNDPHPNIEGTATMARNIHDYLVTELRGALERHRLARRRGAAAATGSATGQRAEAPRAAR